MIPYWNINRDLALFKFHDRLCDWLILALANGYLDHDDFYKHYEYHDYYRYKLGFDSLFDVWFNDRYRNYL